MEQSGEKLLTNNQRKIILETIPTNLGGKQWVKVRSQQLVKEPQFPRMVISELTSGIRKHFYADIIHKTKYYNHPADVFYGQIDRATFSIILYSENREEVEGAVAELQKWFLKEDYYFIWNKQRVFFRGVISAGEIIADYNERNGKIIYRGSVDFAVDYEVSWKEDADAIQRFDFTLRKDEEAVVRFVATSIGAYVMSVKIVKY